VKMCGGDENGERERHVNRYEPVNVVLAWRLGLINKLCDGRKMGFYMLSNWLLTKFFFFFSQSLTHA
jgi:hypothetical protein